MTDLKAILRTLPNHGTDDGDEAPNPGEREYIGWDPHADYLIGKGEGWNSTMTFESSQAFLDGIGESDPDMNLAADFYFAISHQSVNCICDGTGYNPATKAIADDFYSDTSRTGRGWKAAITQDEVDALQTEGRLRRFDGENYVEAPGMTAAEVNAAEASGANHHDAINRFILIRTRAKRLGVYGQCDYCQGEGYRRTSEDYLVLNIWLLHPRKGASRGVEVKNVSPEHLPKLREWLTAHGLAQHLSHFAWCQATGRGAP